MNEIFNVWLKETGRSGGVLMGSSIREFFTWCEIKYTIQPKEVKAGSIYITDIKDQD